MKHIKAIASKSAKTTLRIASFIGTGVMLVSLAKMVSFDPSYASTSPYAGMTVNQLLSDESRIVTDGKGDRPYEPEDAPLVMAVPEISDLAMQTVEDILFIESLPIPADKPIGERPAKATKKDKAKRATLPEPDQEVAMAKPVKASSYAADDKPAKEGILAKLFSGSSNGSLIKGKNHIDLSRLSSREIKCLVDNVYYEARGEGKEGWKAVIAVTMNRSNDPQKRWSKDVCKVVYADHQFSWTLSPHSVKDKASWASIAKYVTSVRRSGFKSNVADATHYHTKKVKPVWSRGEPKVASIKSHNFFKVQ